MMKRVAQILVALQLAAYAGVAYADDYDFNVDYNNYNGQRGGYSNYKSSSTSSSNAKGSSSSSSYGANAYGYNFFADSQSTYYDGYQQAWRYLGWYVKCGAPSDRYNQQNSHSNSNDESTWEGNNYCQRFLIWAAYVDESYEGGGIGEYSYYDPYTSSWDESACDVHGNGRCAPMDCHLSNTTTWKLMGIFKEASYFGNDAFFEQLFKHEGICLWNDEDLYEFMSEAREGSWPQGCVNTGVLLGDNYYTKNGDGYLYLDLKPTWNGNMTYGLYVDYVCKTEYEGTAVDVDTVAASMGLLYGDYVDKWNDALEVYKVCQPCRAYNLKNDFSSYSNSSNNKGYYYSDNDGSSSYNSPNEGYFECRDDAGYTDVNQCMKFRTHAELEVATWEDLVTATNQGGILEVLVGDTIFGSERMSKEQYQYELAVRQDEAKLELEEIERYHALVRKYEQEEKESLLMGEAAFFTGLGVLSMVVVVGICKRMCRATQKSEPLLSEYSE